MRTRRLGRWAAMTVHRHTAAIVTRRHRYLSVCACGTRPALVPYLDRTTWTMRPSEPMTGWDLGWLGVHVEVGRPATTVTSIGPAT